MVATAQPLGQTLIPRVYNNADGTYSLAVVAEGAGGVVDNVNVAQVGGTTTDTNTGTVSAGTQRVTLATNVALPTGTNVLGKVSIDQTTPGTTNLVATNADSVVAGGTAPAKALLQGVQYNSTQPTLTNAQAAATQCDTRGNTLYNQATRIDPTNDQIGTMFVANSQSIAVTTSGAGYIAGDCVGGIISLTTVNYASGRRVVLRSLQINDKGGVAPSLNIYFFKSTPTAGTYTDNSPVVWGTTDSSNKVGQVRVLNGDYMTDISQSSVNYGGLNQKLPVNATTLFMLIVAEGSYTLASSTITIDAEIDQE